MASPVVKRVGLGHLGYLVGKEAGDAAVLRIWTLEHRDLLLAVVVISIWVFAHWWFLRLDIQRWRRRTGAHTWSVDMVTKSSKGGRANTHH